LKAKQKKEAEAKLAEMKAAGIEVVENKPEEKDGVEDDENQADG